VCWYPCSWRWARTWIRRVILRWRVIASRTLPASRAIVVVDCCLCALCLASMALWCCEVGFAPSCEWVVVLVWHVVELKGRKVGFWYDLLSGGRSRDARLPYASVHEQHCDVRGAYSSIFHGHFSSPPPLLRTQCAAKPYVTALYVTTTLFSQETFQSPHIHSSTSTQVGTLLSIPPRHPLFA